MGVIQITSSACEETLFDFVFKGTMVVEKGESL